MALSYFKYLVETIFEALRSTSSSNPIANMSVGKFLNSVFGSSVYPLDGSDL